jgi:2'-5' RNA ligase
MTESVLHLRVFFAIDLPAGVQASISEIIQKLQKAFPQKSIRWAKPEDLHVTLQFQKAIDAIDVTRLVNKVRSTIVGFAPFEMKLGPLQWFPAEDDRRLIVLGAAPETDLAVLANRIGEGIIDAGYELPQQNFRGHLSLCRMNMDSAEALQLPQIDLKLPPVKVDHVILFRSEQSHEGPFYTILERFHAANL